MSIEDRDWYRKDYEKRRGRAERDDLRAKRQAGIDAMWNEVEPARRRQYVPKMSSNSKRRNSFFHSIIQFLGILAVLAVSAAVVFYVLDEHHLLPDIHGLKWPQIPARTERISEKNDRKNANKSAERTVVIPPNLVYRGSSQDEILDFATRTGCVISQHTDGSQEIYCSNLSMDIYELISSIGQNCASSTYPHFISVDANDDYTEFSFIVNDITMSSNERQAMTDLFLLAGMNAVESGHTETRITVTFLNMKGSLVRQLQTDS